MPRLVEDDYCALLVEIFKLGDNLVGLFGHALVEVFACLVELVYLFAHGECRRQIALDKQVYGYLALLYASRCVYARAYLEDNVVDGNLFLSQSAHLNDGFEAGARIVIQLLDSMVREYAVFAHIGHEVRGDAHCHKVEQRIELLGRNAVVLCECLHEFEAHSAAREVGVGVGRVGTLGVQDGYCAGQLLVGHMVVAHDKVDSFLFGVCNLLDGLNSAVEHNYKFHSRRVGVVYSSFGNSIAILVSVGNVVVDVK